MKIKSILFYLGILHYLSSATYPLQAAPLKIETIPIIHSSIEYPSQTWRGINNNFEGGLHFLVNQQFSVWGIVGQENLSLAWPKQYIWTKVKSKKEEGEKKKNQTKQESPYTVYRRECNLQNLGLSNIHFGLGVRFVAMPQFVVGGYYHLGQPACINQLNHYDHQIEKLEYKHFIGIELINPSMQWNLTGYWQALESIDQFMKHKDLRNLKRFGKQKAQSDPSHFDRLLEEAPEHYTAYAALMFDRWGMITKLQYVYQHNLKGFVSAYYMSFPYDRFQSGLQGGLEYKLQRFLMLTPKISWNSTYGCQFACTASLEWRDKNISQSAYLQPKYYLTQSLPREKVPFIFKKDFHSKQLNSYYTHTKKNPHDVVDLNKRIAAEQNIGEILSSYFPLVSYISSDPKLESAAAQHNRNMYKQFPRYISAMESEGTILGKFLKAFFDMPLIQKPYRELSPMQPTRVQFSLQEQSIPDPVVRDVQTLPNTQHSLAKRNSTQYANLTIGDIYYGQNDDQVPVAYVVESLENSQNGGLVPNLIGTVVGQNEPYRKIYKNQVYDYETGTVIKKCNNPAKKGSKKISRVKLYPNYSNETFSGTRIMFTEAGEAILET